MRVVGVLDLIGGRAVHALRGRRDQYAPVSRVAGSRIESGDALALARAYVERLGVGELYVADLDAISRHVPPHPVIGEIAALGSPLWLDAGIRSGDEADAARRAGAAQVVVGLETLPSFAALSATCSAAGGGWVAFSLDVRDGQLVTDAAFPPGDPPEVIAARAVDCGVGAIIVIDLARVGTGAGIDLLLIARIRAAAPAVVLIAGGGVREADDLVRLAEVGCDGALVATALHDGRLSADEVAALRRLSRSSGGKSRTGRSFLPLPSRSQ